MEVVDAVADDRGVDVLGAGDGLQRPAPARGGAADRGGLVGGEFAEPGDVAPRLYEQVAEVDILTRQVRDDDVLLGGEDGRRHRGVLGADEALAHARTDYAAASAASSAGRRIATSPGACSSSHATSGALSPSVWAVAAATTMRS